jgi:hypothetical protein
MSILKEVFKDKGKNTPKKSSLPLTRKGLWYANKKVFPNESLEMYSDLIIDVT